MKHTATLFILLSILFSCRTGDEVRTYDLVIYGATPAGISAAIQATRMEKSCIIIEASEHIGGATTGGLGWTDYGVKETVGGISLEFYQKLFQHYQTDASWPYQDPDDYTRLESGWAENHQVMWTFEPKVALRTFTDWLQSYEIEVVTGSPIHLENGVEKEGTQIKAIRTGTGIYFGKIFLDCSYEGDLLAQAGVSYEVGREARAKYNEPLAGILSPEMTDIRQPKAMFGKAVDAFNEKGELLFGIQDTTLGIPESGDHKIQAYNFRTCLTDAAANRLPIERPVGYDSTRYELLFRYIRAQEIQDLKKVLKISPLPNRKTDINDGCPFSMDYIGHSWDYPEGDYERRQEIVQDHYDYTLGLFYFLGNDPRLPETLRSQMLQYGLPIDEYIDNGHWSPQLYIRETRRMTGEYVLTQHDCQTNRVKEKPIGMASYGPDSHHIQRVYTKKWGVINEGNFLEHRKAYQIPLGIILPKAEECRNLLVPVCVSSSHVAFGSIRMEPVYMIMGQSAATLAGLALDAGTDLHLVSYSVLQDRLLADGQVLTLEE